MIIHSCLGERNFDCPTRATAPAARYARQKNMHASGVAKATAGADAARSHGFLHDE